MYFRLISNNKLAPFSSYLLLLTHAYNYTNTRIEEKRAAQNRLRALLYSTSFLHFFSRSRARMAAILNENLHTF